MKKKYFKDFLNKYASQIDASITAYFNQKKSELNLDVTQNIYNHLGEYCTRDGKRIRPIMLLATYFGYGSNSEFKDSDIIRLSSVLEIMHSLLLIQDDMIDNSQLRRGSKAFHLLVGDDYNDYTRNETVGNDVSYIVSDILFANSIEIISEIDLSLEIKNRFLKIFAQTYQMTAWGQILDILYSLPKDFKVPESVPNQISTFKTAYYTISFPAQMGFTLTGKDDSEERKKIEGFALPLGLAFQIRDDILGVFGKEELTGKPSDSDIEEGKLTMLIFDTYKNLNGKEKDHFASIFSNPDKKKSEIEEIRTYIENSGARNNSEVNHQELIAQAGQNLQKLSLNDDIKDVFSGLIHEISKI